MLIIYSIMGMLLPNNVISDFVSPFKYFKSSVLSFLPIWGFYSLSKDTEVSDKRIFTYIIILLISAIYNYFFLFSQLSLEHNGGDDYEVTNNTGYTFLAIIPLLFFVTKKTFLRMVLMLVIAAFIISSMKRGAILIGAILFIIFAKSVFGNIERKSYKVLIFVAIIALFALIAMYISYMYDNSVFFRYRIEQTQEGYSSHRDEIYTTIFDYWRFQSSVSEFLIGGGPNSSVRITNGYLAHNDWFELLANQGLLGIIIYLVYWFCFIKQWFFLERNYYVRTAFGVLIILLVMKSFFSMSYNSMPLATQLAIALCLVRIDQGPQIDTETYYID